jgi:hypothetical protein
MKKQSQVKSKIGKEKLALVLGGITLLLFASRLYILDLIEPSKSIGQVIGENAKDLIESLNGKRILKHRILKEKLGQT